MKLKDKIIIVTGGAKGIGYGCAKACAGHGATVVLADRDLAAAEETAGELPSASAVRCDVTSEADMRSAIDGTAEKFGRLDCIVNNAGWHPPAMTIDETSIEDFESLLRLNLTSTFMGCKFAAPHLRKTGGSIVIIASAVGVFGQGEAVSYAATKAGQIGIIKALGLDMIKQGVRVNGICPSNVRTPLMEAWAATLHDPQAALKMVESTQPAGKMAEPQEIGELCAFLASDEASFIAGQAIIADAGASLGYGLKYIE
jgi:NAD(P)-dependent dehydrogenase (short-subunit alcohol dehydrogenase family)